MNPKSKKYPLALSISIGLFLLAAKAMAYPLEIELPNMPSSISDPGVYVKYLFIFGLSLAGFLAVGAVALGGIRYMLAGVSASNLQKAKDLIIGGLAGVALLLSSYLLLATIDPTLTELTPKIDPAEEIAAPPPGAGGCDPICDYGYTCSAEKGYTCVGIAAMPTTEDYHFSANEFGSGQPGQAGCQTFAQNYLIQKNDTTKNTGFAYTLTKADWTQGNLCYITLEKKCVGTVELCLKTAPEWVKKQTQDACSELEKYGRDGHCRINKRVWNPQTCECDACNGQYTWDFTARECVLKK